MLKKQIERHYRVPECAQLSGLRESTWRKWILLGKVSYAKVGGATCIPESELRRILEQGRVPARQAAQ